MVGSTIVDADGVVVVVFAGEGPLSAFLAQDVILILGKLLAPLGISSSDWKLAGLAGHGLRLGVLLGRLGGYYAGTFGAGSSEGGSRAVLRTSTVQGQGREEKKQQGMTHGKSLN